MWATLTRLEWPAFFPGVLFGLRSSLSDDSGLSSAKLVLGSPLILPAEFFDSTRPPTTKFVQHLRQAPSLLSTQPLSYAAVAVAPPRVNYLYICGGGVLPLLDSPYIGPYKVLGHEEINCHCGSSQVSPGCVTASTCCSYTPWPAFSSPADLLFSFLCRLRFRVAESGGRWCWAMWRRRNSHIFPENPRNV